MKTGDALGHPLFLMPVMLLGVIALIEGLHTSAHLHQQIDVHGYCRNNAEWVESKTGGYDDDY